MTHEEVMKEIKGDFENITERQEKVCLTKIIVNYHYYITLKYNMIVASVNFYLFRYYLI